VLLRPDRRTLPVVDRFRVGETLVNRRELDVSVLEDPGRRRKAYGSENRVQGSVLQRHSRDCCWAGEVKGGGEHILKPKFTVILSGW
jgi:hypothetical protein